MSGVLTEHEAQQKVCPFIRYTVNEEAVIHREQPPLVVHQNCIGSTCIAWRNAENYEGYGYCGIAGVPYGVAT